MYQVLDHRPQRQRGHEGQRADEQHRADQQHHEQRRMRRQVPALAGMRFLAASEPAMASTGIISQKRPNNIAMPSAML